MHPAQSENVALQSLRTIAEALRPLGRHAVFYLAAAVSDFYIPWPQMVRLVFALQSLTLERHDPCQCAPRC